MSVLLKMQQGIVISLLILLVAEYSVGQGSNQPYQPECDSWDEVVSAIRDSITSQGASVGDCDKLDDCTGMKCVVTALGKTVEIDVKLFHCDDPPQMRILVAGNGVSFEETITHGSTYTISGLSYSPVPFFPALDIAMVVQFEKQPPDGIVIGAKMRTVGAPIEFPLFSDILIRTPVCTTADPLMMDCLAMEELVASIDPPPSCSKKTTCDGISCTQKYTVSSGSLPVPDIHVLSDLIVDSCSTPISLILKAESRQLNLDWTHTYPHSDSVLVDQNLSYGATVVVNVTMVPLSDLEHIRTTIIYTITQAVIGSFTESVLTNALVPIPECRDVPPSDVTPTPASDECASWKHIENALEFSFEGGYSISDCVTLPGCRGFNCTATYDSDIYYIVIEEFHCQDPTYITVSIDGPNEHYSQNFTHNDTVPIPDANGVEVLVHIVKESPSVIFVGVYILYPVPGGEIITFPLVSDQLLQVTPCEEISTVTMETTKRESPGGGYSHSPTSRPSGVTSQSTTVKTDQGKPTKNSGNEDNKPFQEPVRSSGSLGLAWNLVFAIISAVVLAVIASAIFVYFRRRRQSRDLDMLMENTDTTHRDSFTPNWNA